MEPLYVGVMSGTSLDGVDIVLASIEPPGDSFRMDMRAFDYIPFEEDMRNHLLQLMKEPALSPAQMLGAHIVLGRWFGEAIRDFLFRYGVEPKAVTAAGVHGLTFQHLPEPISILGSQATGTWQLGDLHTVRQICRVRTIGDFRSADMALGGQGAPLAPFIDRLCFAHDAETRVLLNLGGIANLTMFQPGNKAVAFDSGPANMMVDLLMERHPTHRARYDKDGQRAAVGKVLPQVLQDCLAHPYFAEEPPKSTGRELFGQAFVDRYFPQSADYDDLVATATQLSATSVAEALKRCMARPLTAQDKLICSGGGVHNPSLMGMLAQQVHPMSVHTTADFGMDPDAKEALLMATLAWAHLHGVPGNLPEVTGASQAVVLGSSTSEA